MPYQTPLKQLRLSYLSAITIICLLAVTAQGLIQWTLIREVDARHSASVIGSQSGRSLRMFYDSEAMLIDIAHTHTYLAEMKHLYPLWEQVQAALPHGNSKLDVPVNLPPEVLTAIASSTPVYARLHTNFATVIQEESKSKPDWKHDLLAIVQIIKDEPQYTTTFSGIYATLQTYADNEVTTVRIIEAILFLLFMLTINYEVFGIIRPAVTSFEHVMKAQAEELQKKALESIVAKEARS